ncbi:hypothetical protein E8E11_011061 [Didymella keratinophila]|nr:hypothetical protein E8E11_011061 [Didymella keratinophila]
MPGPSGKTSWWAETRDICTLLKMFGESQASDPRDMIYALLGISSDAQGSEILLPEYDKALEDVIITTLDFVIGLAQVGLSSRSLPVRSLPQLRRVCHLDLYDLREDLVICAFNEKVEASSTLKSPGFSDIRYSDRSWRTLQAAQDNIQVLGLQPDGEWGLLLDIEPADIQYLDNLPQQTRILRPLFWATQAAWVDMIKILLLNGVDVNTRDQAWSESPLCMAARLGLVEIVDTLLEHQKADMNFRDCGGRTPLMLAVTYCKDEIVRKLLKRRDLDPNLEDHAGDRPLTLATKMQDEIIVNVLLEDERISVNATDHQGRTALETAVAKGYASIAQSLLQSRRSGLHAEAQIFNPVTLVAFCADGYMPIINVLLDTGRIDVTARDESGRTSLVAAAASGHFSVVKKLLTFPEIDVDAKDANGQTALVAASGRGYSKIVDTLLKQPNIHASLPNQFGQTPLVAAVEQGHYGTVEVLLEHSGINTSLPNQNGKEDISRC